MRWEQAPALLYDLPLRVPIGTESQCKKALDQNDRVLFTFLEAAAASAVTAAAAAGGGIGFWSFSSGYIPV